MNIMKIMNMTNNNQRHFPSLALRFGYYAADVTWESATRSLFSNCYTYALNLPDSCCHNPGQLSRGTHSHLKTDDITKLSMHLLMINDGLKPITSHEALSGKFHAIACRLRLRGTPDYHILRFDHQEEKWSHQKGVHYPGWNAAANPPSNTDDNGKFIKNPEHGIFKSHPIFLGYYAIPEP